MTSSGRFCGFSPLRPACTRRAADASHVTVGHRYHATVTTGLDQDLLTQLSADQKVALLAGVDTWHTAGFDDPPVPPIRMSDGPAGVRGTSWSGTGIGLVPVRRRPRCDAGIRQLVEEIGRALGREAHSKSANVVLAPTVNLHRTPVGGRNFECYSEDPVLTAEIAVAYVRGLQAERRRRVHQALRRQRHRVRADDDLVGDRRAHAARAVPRPVRGRRPPGRRAHGHVRLQPPQRHVLQRAPLAADRAAARRVGLRRRRRQRLVRHAQRGRVAAGRSRRGDARPATSARRAPARGAGPGRGHGRRSRPVRRPGARPRRLDGRRRHRHGGGRPPTTRRRARSSGGRRHEGWCC